MVRIAALSDIHGNLPALAAVRKAVDAARPDYVAICGDLGFNGPDPAGTLALVKELEKSGAFITLGNTSHSLPPSLAATASRQPAALDCLARNPSDDTLGELRGNVGGT